APLADDAHAGLAAALALLGQLPAHAQRVADLDRRLEAPLVPAERGDARALGVVGPPHQALGDRQAEQAVRDARAELGLLAEFLVGVDLAVVAREAGEAGEVSLGNGSAWAEPLLVLDEILVPAAEHDRL